MMRWVEGGWTAARVLHDEKKQAELHGIIRTGD